MPISKFRAAIAVFLVGFALGISVFAASRLFVRSVLNGDAIHAAEELAGRVGQHRATGAGTALSAIVRYTHFDLDGNLVESAEPSGKGATQSELSEEEKARIADLAVRGGSVIESTSLLSGLLGLPNSAIKKVVVPVVVDGTVAGSLLVEVDQTQALASLTRAFSIVAMVTIGLAALAVISIALIVTRGRGFREKKVFDPGSVARDPLTGVPTRAGFERILDDVVERATEADRQVLLMIVGIDRFSGVNAIWGHAVGDKVLKLAAERLRAIADGPGGVSRVAGDEFALIVEGEAAHGTRQLADQIREAVGDPVRSRRQVDHRQRLHRRRALPDQRR